jgi:vitamin B12 transporter
MTIKNTTVSAAAALFCVAPVSAGAQSPAPNSDNNNDEIIVEGLRLATPASEIGSSVSIITAEDIELRGYAFALDALASAPGITVNQNGAFGGLATVRIRGAASDQTLVLLDGVPLGDPTAVGGGYDFSLLDAADIDRIEVLKGPQSTLWGSDAIGGVVNIITKRPDAGIGARLFAEGGSFKTYRGGVAVFGANDAGDFRLAASGISSDGISKADADDGNGEADDYDGRTFAARGGLNLPHGMRLEARARYMEGETEIDGFPPPNFSLADTSDNSKTEQFTTAATLSAPLFGDRLENSFMAGFTDIKRTGNFGGFVALDKGDRLILRYQGTLNINARHRLAFGAEREENEANSDKTSVNGLFALYELKPFDGLTLTAGVRNDDHSRFGSATTARAAAAWSPSPYVTLRGSWGEGFKAPTIFQLTQTFGLLPANGDLRPETSSAFDIGVDLTAPSSRARLSVTYFDRDTENLIIFAPNFRYENLDATKANGIETALDITVTDTISIATSYAYIDAEDATTGERQIRIPRHSGDFAVIYKTGPISGSAVLRYNGAESEGAFGTDVPSWVRVDLAASYQVNETIELYTRIENLFDENYQQISGFGTPGLSATGGVRLAF